MIHHRHVAGARNGEHFFQIKAWARARGGWMAFDSSTGFRLPEDSVLRPDLVVELASPGEEGPHGLTALRRMLAADQRNGAHLGWLLIPSERAAEVWGPLETGEQGRRIEAATRLEGDPLFSGPRPAGLGAHPASPSPCRCHHLLGPCCAGIRPPCR